MQQNNYMMNGNNYNQQNYQGGDRGNNKFNNRSREGRTDGGGRGRGRGGYNKNQNQPNQQQHTQSQGQNDAPNLDQTQKQVTPGDAQPNLTLPQIDVSPLDNMASQDQRNNFVGNNIYGVVQQAYGDENAPRITGMLLDENAVNFKQLLTDNEYFIGKVNEAYTLLMNSLTTKQ